jgi:5-methylcytosine-specific restriction endonuclease McrA
MGKKLLTTPRSRTKQALRQLWLRSRERARRLKLDGYICTSCGIKQSKAKGREVDVQVHHIQGIEWEYLIDEVYRVLLVHPSQLETLCKACHEIEGIMGGNDKE